MKAPPRFASVRDAQQPPKLQDEVRLLGEALQYVRDVART